MNALEELKHSLFRIVKKSDASNLNGAHYSAKSLSEMFIAYDQNLSKGWERVADFCHKVDLSIVNDFEYLFDDINKYIEASESNESQEQKAVEEANREAEMILKELGIE